MPGWTLVDTDPTQGCTYQRPLDALELWFLWDGLFNGTADFSRYCKLRLLNGPQDAHLFSDANITRAWLSTKRRYPLVGATVQGAESVPPPVHPGETRRTDLYGSSSGNGTGFASEPHFVVREHDLAVLRPGEIVFGSVACAEDAQRQAAAILDGPRPLSEELLVRLYVFRETNPERTDVLHLMTLTAHCVADDRGDSTFMRCLLDTLARGGEPEPAQIPLEDRLAMVIPSMDLGPMRLRSLSPAIRRWRRAVGMVILQLRMAKRQGGHTLPCRLTPSTPQVAARSGFASTRITRTQTATVTTNCRLHGITFGNAYLTLAQVAMTRVLYRRYLRGEISEEEWEYRKRQPHISGGPLSLRSYLDDAWFKSGGGGEFMLSISLFFYQLPFMTLGETMGRRRVLSDDAPPFSDLLTFDRFLHRARSVEEQVTAFFTHPLFFEIVHAVGLLIAKQARFTALHWMKQVGSTNGHDIHDDDDVLAVTDIPMINAYSGSSAGSADLRYPSEYPLPPTHPLSPYSSIPHPGRAGYAAPLSPPPSTTETDTTPKIAMENLTIRLRVHPAELYLTAHTLRERIEMFVFYDTNVFEEGVVREWLDEVREAVLWYLGQTHRSRGAIQSRGGGAACSQAATVQAKL